MNKLLSIILFAILLSGCASHSLVIQKIDSDVALIAYPASKNEFGLWDYEKIYYVEDNILRDYADNDKITGYKVEKTPNETYSYTNLNGHPRTVSAGQLVTKN